MEPAALVVVLRVVRLDSLAGGPGCGRVVELVWPVPPTLAQILHVLARYALTARRAGCFLEVVAAPPALVELLEASGFVLPPRAEDGTPRGSSAPSS